MNTFKLVVGILSVILAMFVLFQSCTAGFVIGVSGDEKDASASGGLFVAIGFLVSGIIAIAARKTKGGTITAGIIYILAGIIGYATKGVYKDLQVWSWLSGIMGAIFLANGITMKKNSTDA